MSGLLAAFALGCCAGVGLAALLLWAVLMAGEGDEDADRGDYRGGGGWG